MAERRKYETATLPARKASAVPILATFILGKRRDIRCKEFPMTRTFFRSALAAALLSFASLAAVGQDNCPNCPGGGAIHPSFSFHHHGVNRSPYDGSYAG